MPSLLESVTSLLEEGDTYDKLGRLIGSDADKARSASAIAAPAVLERLADEAADEQRASGLLKLMEGDNPAGTDIGRYLTTRAPEVGNRMLDDLVNGDRDEWSSAAASSVDISGSQMDKLLATLTPITVAVLSKRRTDDKLDGAGVAKLLAAERAGLGSGGPTPGASVPATGPAGIAPAGDDDRSGLGWIGWAIGAVVLVLLLAWLLSTCNDETAELQGQNNTTVTPATVTGTGTGDNEGAGAGDVGDGDVDSGAGVESGAAGELQAEVDAALAGSGVTGIVSGGEVQLTGTVEDEQGRVGAETLVKQLSGVTTVINDVLLDDDVPVDVPIDVPVDDTVDGTVDSTVDDTVDGALDDTVDPAENPIDSGTTINDLLDLDPVTFRVSSATITEAGNLVLDEAVAFMAENPDISIEVGGHTDSDGQESDNQILSQIRADSVKAYLVAGGIDAERMVTKGYGETEPKVPNDSSEAKAQNRRIEFTVL